MQLNRLQTAATNTETRLNGVISDLRTDLTNARTQRNTARDEFAGIINALRMRADAGISFTRDGLVYGANITAFNAALQAFRASPSPAAGGRFLDAIVALLPPVPVSSDADVNRDGTISQSELDDYITDNLGEDEYNNSATTNPWIVGLGSSTSGQGYIGIDANNDGYIDATEFFPSIQALSPVYFTTGSQSIVIRVINQMLDKVYAEGWSDGYEEGYKDGFRDGVASVS